jgi:hypothetical protein
LFVTDDVNVVFDSVMSLVRTLHDAGHEAVSSNKAARIDFLLILMFLFLPTYTTFNLGCRAVVKILEMFTPSSSIPLPHFSVFFSWILAP